MISKAWWYRRPNLWTSAVAMCGGSPSIDTRPAAPRSVPVEVSVRLNKSRFIEKELVPLTVVLKNTGGSPVGVPAIADGRNRAITYTLRGPNYTAGVTFDYRGIAARPVDGDAPSETIAPGDSVESNIPVEQLARLAPGEYELTARFAANGSTSEAPPVHFQISKPAIRDAKLMLDVGAQNPMLIRVLVLDGEGEQQRLLQAFFRETRSDLGETALTNLVEAVPAPADARATLPTWTNFMRGQLLYSRFAWQGEGVVGVETNPPRGSARAPIKGVAVEPALMSNQGDVDVFAVDGTRFTLNRFARAGSGAEAIANGTLPEGTAMHTAVGGPAALPDARALVSVVQVGANVEVIVNAQGQPARRAIVANAFVLPESRPAGRYRPDGVLDVACVLAEDREHRRVFAADIEFPAGAAEPASHRSEAYTLAAPYKASAAAYDATSTAARARRDWVVLLGNGSAMVSRTPLEPVAVSGRPVLPLQLLSMSQVAYLVVHDDETVLKLEPLQ
jgi:hypothetical protein